MLGNKREEAHKENFKTFGYVNTRGEKQETEWPHPEKTEMTKQECNISIITSSKIGKSSRS